MFTALSVTGSVRRSTGLLRPAGARHADPSANRFFRIAAVAGLLAGALPAVASAQAIGTMQVTARVLPASVAWSAVSEAGLAAGAAVRTPAGQPLIRRNGLILSSTEIRRAGESRVVLVTIQHPHN